MKSRSIKEQKNEFSLKALESSPFDFTVEAAGVVRLISDKAFMAGVAALKAILTSETKRISSSIEKSRVSPSDFERGILEGVHWLCQSVVEEAK